MKYNITCTRNQIAFLFIWANYKVLCSEEFPQCMGVLYCDDAFRLGASPNIYKKNLVYNLKAGCHLKGFSFFFFAFCLLNCDKRKFRIIKFFSCAQLVLWISFQVYLWMQQTKFEMKMLCEKWRDEDWWIWPLYVRRSAKVCKCSSWMSFIWEIGDNVYDFYKIDNN